MWLAQAAVARADESLLVLGDSLSAGYGIAVERGWVALLQQRLRETHHAYQVVNASISGETSEGARARLPALLDRHHPALVVIELGANDGLRGFPAPLLCANLDAMIDLASQHGAKVLLVAVQIPPNYGPRYTQAYDRCFTDAATNHHIPLAPSLLGDVPLHDELMQKDGLHPLAEAQPQLLDHVWPYLQPLLKK